MSERERSRADFAVKAPNSAQEALDTRARGGARRQPFSRCSAAFSAHPASGRAAGGSGRGRGRARLRAANALRQKSHGAAGRLLGSLFFSPYNWERERRGEQPTRRTRFYAQTHHNWPERQSTRNSSERSQRSRPASVSASLHSVELTSNSAASLPPREPFTRSSRYPATVLSLRCFNGVAKRL